MKSTIIAAAAVFALAGCAGTPTTAPASTPTDTPEAAKSTTTVKPAPDYNTIPGNGTHEMGGVDGKNWGIYVATVPAGPGCSWSVRSVSQYRGGLVLNEGQAAEGETVRVSIQPDGDVSTWTGLIDDDHRIVFMTSGCGSWSAS